jgi:hypothetical protein
MICYKVLRVIDGKYYSSYRNGYYSQEYFGFQDNYPKIKTTEIFVFKSFDDALEFARQESCCNQYNMSIWLSHSKKIRKIVPLCIVFDYFSELNSLKLLKKEFLNYWDNVRFIRSKKRVPTYKNMKKLGSLTLNYKQAYSSPSIFLEREVWTNADNLPKVH